MQLINSIQQNTTSNNKHITNKIDKVRVHIGETFKDVDHDKMLLKGCNYYDNNRVLRYISDCSIKDALLKCAWLDYFKKFEQ